MNSRYFKEEEFACKCGCGYKDISQDLVTKLDHIRDMMKIPLKITSGCRCVEHNKAVGGEKDSAHCRGKAADVAIAGSIMRFTFLRLAYMYFKRIGIYKDWIHVDVDEELPQLVLWVK